jgi:ABC-type branched-subunit amino acid transport system permease subunit
VRPSRAGLVVALLAAAFLAPRLAPSSYAANVLVTLALYVVLALAFDLMAGHVGAVSLAAPAFYAIGAYAAGILATRYEAGFPVTLVAGTALGAVVAVAVGWPLFRLSDLAFAIGSLGLGLIAAALANNLTDLTGGAMCTTGVAPARLALGPLVLSTATPRSAYVVVALLAGVALLAYLALTTYRTGRTVAMIQGDEPLASALGVNPLRHKLTLFAASGALTAAAGVFYAHYTTVVCPADFSPFLTINLLVMVFVGGPGSAAGVLLGAALFVGMSEAVRGFAHLGNLLFGAILLVAVLAFPRGIWGWVTDRAWRRGSAA